MQLEIKTLEINKLSLSPGETLVVKLKGDTFSEQDTAALKERLTSFFPNNKVMVFMLPTGNDLILETIQEEIAPVQEQKTNETVS